MRKPLIIFASFAAIGVLLYFYLKKDKNKAVQGGFNAPQASNPTQPTQPAKATNAQIAKYAGWFDRIEEIANQMKKGTIKEATPEMVKNGQLLFNLSEDSLRRAISYWEARRNRKITTLSPFVNFFDKDGSTIDLFARLRELKYFEN